jgi:hypothetical protein
MKRYFVFLSIVFTIFLLTLILRDFVREKIIVPILKIAQIVEEIPQALLWFSLILIIPIFVLGRLRGLFLMDFPVRNKQIKQKGKIAPLVHLIEKARNEDYFRRKLSRYLGDLTVGILAYRKKSTPEMIKERLWAGTLDIPQEMRDHLKIVLEDNGLQFKKRKKRFIFFKNPYHYRELDPLRVVEFMEEQLEIENGRK